MSEEKLSGRLEKLAAKYGMAYEDAEIMESAAQLVRRVEEAPSGEVWQHMVAAGQRTSFVIGQRVRLVREA